MNEIIYVCNSINNRNVRQGELKILEKHEDQKYFEFGENTMNIKKRFYKDLKTLNKDYEALLKLKEQEENPEKIEEKIIEENNTEEKIGRTDNISDIIKTTEKESQGRSESKKKYPRKNSKLF